MTDCVLNCSYNEIFLNYSYYPASHLLSIPINSGYQENFYFVLILFLISKYKLTDRQAGVTGQPY